MKGCLLSGSPCPVLIRGGEVHVETDGEVGPDLDALVDTAVHTVVTRSDNNTVLIQIPYGYIRASVFILFRDGKGVFLNWSCSEYDILPIGEFRGIRPIRRDLILCRALVHARLERPARPFIRKVATEHVIGNPFRSGHHVEGLLNLLDAIPCPEIHHRL